jgi:acyl-[acyl-carrier-protein]-phospholipid O-acyltransferase/long-chain-fatty-acid--[acyl-carrier-protein] ligase
LFVIDIFRTIRGLKSDRYLQLAVIGSAYFLFLGAFIQQTLLYYGTSTLGLSLEKSAYLFPMSALGIGVGAIIAGRLSGRNIEIGVVPIGALGLTVCSLMLGNSHISIPVVLGVVFLLGVSSGLYIVPLNAFIQYRAPAERRGEILASCNFLSFLGAAISAGVFFLMSRTLELSPSTCFIVIGLLTAILAATVFLLLPDFLVRLGVVSITRLFYRIRVGGAENVPVRGGALLISNHVTWVDALLIAATQQRRVIFMMERRIYNTWWIKPLFKMMRVISVSHSDSPRKIIESLKAARTAIGEGYLVCIFAEGALTRNGCMHEFRGGYERIVKGTDYPIIPIHIGGAWGSIFSHYNGKLLSSMPRKIPYPVSVTFGEHLPPTATPTEVRLAVSELACEVENLKKTRHRTLADRVIHTARRNWFKMAISDTSGKQLTFGKTLTASIALGDILQTKMKDEEEMVGIVLPASAAGVLSNIAITISGIVPVNLNFTASKSALESAIHQCSIRTVITSHKFLDKLSDFEIPADNVIFLEDIIPEITRAQKTAAFFKAIFLSPRKLAGGRRIGPDDLATIIFSSGSTSEPKGVMLSNHNIISNIEAIQAVFKFEKQDRFCAVLPFFHSFGLTATLWAPLVCGFPAYYHPNPLDGTVIGNMVRENKLTVMVATPTFLLAYIRRAQAEDFSTLRAMITGAEKLKPRVADSFEKKFGIRPMEGYGATELSPVAALSQADVELAGVKQTGNKPGSVGLAVPGCAARIVDPDTFELLAPDTDGLLQIKGPNVMLGYLGKDDLTKEALHDGWYNTGDIAHIDKEGFIYLVDRLSRYSKIGGEMVPHMAVEDILQNATPTEQRCVVITAAPDKRKGEQLVVIHTQEAGDIEVLQEAIRHANIPNLWKPKKDNYIKVDVIPTLGTGKIDLKGIKEIAREFIEVRPGAIQRAVDKLRP